MPCLLCGIVFFVVSLSQHRIFSEDVGIGQGWMHVGDTVRLGSLWLGCGMGTRHNQRSGEG